MSTKTNNIPQQESRQVAIEKLGEVVIRFAGDSGDGMQLTGSQFTSTSALVGNDLATFPGFSGGDSSPNRYPARGVRRFRYALPTMTSTPPEMLPMYSSP